MTQQMIVIRGSRTLTQGVLDDSSTSLFSLPNLSKYLNIVPLGDKTTGISLSEIEGILPTLIQPGSQELNIIVAMHGDVEDGKYMLTCDEEVQSSEFFKCIVKATSGIKLNMFFLSCLGANAQDSLGLLPKGSKMITLSDRDHETIPDDYRHAKASEISDVLAQYPFKLENILTAYLFCQKFTFNTPIIGMHKKDGSIEVNTMQDLAREHVSATLTPRNSDFVQKLCKIVDISEKNIITAIEKFQQHEGHIESLQCKADILSIMLPHLKSGSFDGFKKAHEREYYFDGALDSLRQTRPEFDGAATPDDIYAQTNPRLNKYAHLEHHISKQNLFYTKDHEEFGKATKERKEELEQDHPNIYMEWHFFEALEAFHECGGKYASILRYDERNFMYDEDGHSNKPIDFSLHINNTAIPVYSVCMGLVLDEYLHSQEI